MAIDEFRFVVEGKCDGDFVRKGVGTTRWQRAQQRVMEAEARGSWDPPPEEQKLEPTTIPGPLLVARRSLFLAVGQDKAEVAGRISDRGTLRRRGRLSLSAGTARM